LSEEWDRTSISIPKKKKKNKRKERKREETLNLSVQEKSNLPNASVRPEHGAMAFPTPKKMWLKPRSLNIQERCTPLMHTGYKEQHCFQLLAPGGSHSVASWVKESKVAGYRHYSKR